MMTPEEAKRFIASVRADQEDPFHAGDPTATRKMERAYEDAYPEGEDRGFSEAQAQALGRALTGGPQNGSGDPMSIYNPARRNVIGVEIPFDKTGGPEGLAEETEMRAREEFAALRALEAKAAAEAARDRRRVMQRHLLDRRKAVEASVEFFENISRQNMERALGRMRPVPNSAGVPALDSRIGNAGKAATRGLGGSKWISLKTIQNRLGGLGISPDSHGAMGGGVVSSGSNKTGP